MKQRALTDADLVGTLEGLGRLRAPYDDLTRATVVDTLRVHPLLPEGTIVEIGAGTGQLRQWLPVALCERVLHTDPSERALELLRGRPPAEVRAEVASAQSLPLDDGASGGVVGLCVFDTLHAAGVGEAAVAELARVLAPGAPFIHVLDMATLLDRPFQEFHAKGLLPLPNVFGDPGDHEWPLDVVLFEVEWLREILHFALQIKHPLVTTFGPYFGAFLLEPFELREAINRFKSVATHSAVQKALALQLASAIQLAVQQGHPAQSAIPFHSGRYLATVMEDAFANSGLFRIEFSELVARSMWTPALTSTAPRYRSLCLGHERISDAYPKRLLSPSARHDLNAGGPAAEGGALVEAASFVFVARRT